MKASQLILNIFLLAEPEAGHPLRTIKATFDTFEIITLTSQRFNSYGSHFSD